MNRTKKITFTAIFAAIAAMLMFFEFPIPFMPPFLKVDLSGAVILIGAYIFGPTSAVAMALIKDLIHLPMTTTGGSGELADFLMTTTLVLVALWIRKGLRESRTGNIAGCAVGTIAMAGMGMLTNYFLIIPFYAQIMPLDAIFSACSAVNPLVNGMSGYLLLGVLPFNLVKGAILSIVTLMLHQKLGNSLYHVKRRTLMHN